MQRIIMKLLFKFDFDTVEFNLTQETLTIFEMSIYISKAFVGIKLIFFAVRSSLFPFVTT